jgi:hypothetical protein
VRRIYRCAHPHTARDLPKDQDNRKEPMSTANGELAAHLTDEAKAAAARRRALLLAATSLSTTATITGAKRALTEYDGPPALIADAVAILDALTVNTT